MHDLITISIPTHRRPTLLLQTLLSCFAQDYRPLEIDISDDSPGTESQELIASLPVPEGISLRYHRNETSLGQAGNVNRLFREARGRRLVLMHDDDMLLPGAITAMANAWDNVPDVVAVYGMQQILSDNGELDQAETDFKAWYYKRDKAHVGAQWNLLVSAFWRQFPNNGYLIDTQAARTAGYRSFEEVGHACDTDFSINLARTARGKCFYMIDRLTSQYRYNLNSLSRSIDVTWKFYDYLINLKGLDPAESTARDSLLREIAEQATKENALRGRRWAALRILFSRHYPRNSNLLKSIYHFALTITPRVRRLRGVRPLSAFAFPSEDRRRALMGYDSSEATAAMREQVAAAGNSDASLTMRRPLTITIVSQDVRYGHGQGRANLELVREAIGRGHHVNIVASEIDATIGASPNVGLYRVDVRGIRPQLLRDAIFNVRAQSIIKTLRKSSDIIHVNGAVVATPSDVNTAHFVHFSHAKFHSAFVNILLSPYQLYQYGYTVLNTVMERRCFRESRAIIAVSRKVAADLIEAGVDRSRLFVIYNGIDLDEFVPGREERSALGLPSGVILGIFVGDIKGQRKNLDTVLRAMVINTELHLAVLAQFAGTNGPVLAAELGIADRVHFIGERKDVAAVMRAADMLIFPSRYEPFGMVILEALASGLPVITSRAAGASEILEPGSGIIVNDENSVEEVAAAIAKLVGSEALRSEMGRRGRDVAEKYSWAHMAKQYMVHYQMLTRQSVEREALPALASDQVIHA